MNKSCNNCGAAGHLFRECAEPIMSCGIVLMTPSRDKVLLIRRRHTIGYHEFMRGKYSLADSRYIVQLWSEMVPWERAALADPDRNFPALWNELWNGDERRDKSEYNDSAAKLAAIDFEPLARYVPLTWSEAEWGFPKGRKASSRETEQACAIREFEEETNIDRSAWSLLDEPPVTENIIGTDGVHYRHKYFLAVAAAEHPVSITTTSQRNEIGEIGWFNLEAALRKIRPYHTDRLCIICSSLVSV